MKLVSVTFFTDESPAEMLRALADRFERGEIQEFPMWALHNVLEPSGRVAGEMLVSPPDEEGVLMVAKHALGKAAEMARPNPFNDVHKWMDYNTLSALVQDRLDVAHQQRKG